MQTARWEEGFCPPGLLVFGGKYPHVLFMGNENSLKVNYGGLGKKKKNLESFVQSSWES